MRIFGYDLKIFKENKTPDEKELGVSGTTIFNGYITSEDYVSELTGTSALTIYDKMRKSDGVVKASLLACELPIRAANWYIEPASDNEKDKEVADFVSECLFEKMSITWDDFLRQALLMLPFGFSVFEKVFQPIEFRGKQMIGWRKFASRTQKTISKWQTEDGKDGIVQTAFTNNVSNVSIPIEKLLIFTHQKEGDNWLGISVLRSAYRPWFFKSHIEKINAIAFERQGLGIPYVKMPKQFTTQDREKAETLLKNIRANEQGFVIEPFEWEIGFKDMKAGTTKDPDETIRRYNREILISVLAQFLDLGSGPQGSRALSADQSTTFHNNLTAIARAIKDVINKYAIKQLVDLNYTVEKYPSLEYSYIGLPRYEAVATALGVLIEKGAVSPDDKLEDYLRQLMNLPKKVLVVETGTPIGKKVISNPKDKSLEDAGDQKVKDIKKKASEFVSWRELTFAEKKVNFTDIRSKMDSASEKLRKELEAVIEKSTNDLIKQFQDVLEASTNTEKMDKLKRIDVGYQGEYKKILYDSILEMFQYGKMMASHEMKKNVPITSAGSLERMGRLADVLTQVMVDDLMKAGKGALLVGLQKKQFSEGLDRIIKSIKEVAKSVIFNGAVINVSGAINQGRREAFVVYSSDIYALQRSEILDIATCNYCLSIDSRVFRKNDSFTQVDSIHSNCRGIWVEILKDESVKPPVEGIPQLLKDAFESVNDFDQLDKPIVKKNSQAEDFLNK